MLAGILLLGAAVVGASRGAFLIQIARSKRNS
jgi:hypothetical protein